ncbi:septal ring lytic transglycosylase RlpA family protein [Caballeronia insecticola]
MLRLRNPGAFACALLIAGCAASPPRHSAEHVSQVQDELARSTEGATSDKSPQTEKARNLHQAGLASWYGRGFNGHRTANGERFDMHAMTAAHRTLPFGSWVRVTLAGRNRSILVRINDRGPFERNRVIDLSYGAAVALGIARHGAAKVELSVTSNSHTRS